MDMDSRPGSPPNSPYTTVDNNSCKYDLLDIEHLRRDISFLPQNSFILSGTVLENISYGITNMPMEQILSASKLATTRDFICELPKGYETEVGENSMLLSGGQRQKISIARAVVRNPRLLIMDEPTNHLDRDAVKLLINNVKTIKNAPAVFIISHDMDAVLKADNAYQLKDGIIWHI